MLRELGEKWYSAEEDTFDGDAITTVFRVLDRETNEPVDGVAFLEQILQDAVPAAHSSDNHDDLAAAAAAVYRAIPVEVSIMEDVSAIPQNSEEDAVVDLWLPMHLALMLRLPHIVAKLLCFHEEHAVAAMDGLARESHFPAADLPAAADGAAAASAGDAASSSHHHHHQPSAAMSSIPGLVECVVRQELGGAVMLLGHYETPHVASRAFPLTGRSNTAAAESSTTTITAAAAEAPTVSTPRHHTASYTAVTPEDSAINTQRNSYLTSLEEEFLSDAGEVYCVANIASALKPLVERAVQYIRAHLPPAFAHPPTLGDREAPPQAATDAANKKEEAACFAVQCIKDHCMAFADLMRRPVLPIDSMILHELCGGDIGILQELLHMFLYTLAPIHKGKKLLCPCTCIVSVAPSPHQIPLSRTNSAMSTPRHSGRGTKTNTAAAATASAAAVNNASMASASGTSTVVMPPPPSTTLEPFWFSVAPQETGQIAFFASWINVREQNSDRHSGDRQRRAAAVLTEYRVTMKTLKRLKENNYVPASSVWSGHLFLAAKLLSKDCSVEDFLDLIAEDGYLNAITYTGIPGALTSVLASGVAAASYLNDVKALRLLSRKVDVLLVDVPGRTSAVRTYLSGRPATHAERFEELWLGSTPLTSSKKFKTRTEMLYFATVELVLEAVEKVWSTTTAADTKEGAADDEGRAREAKDDVLAALQGYVSTWRGFFINLRDRPSPAARGRSRSRSSDVRLTPRARHVNPNATPIVNSPVPTAFGSVVQNSPCQQSNNNNNNNNNSISSSSVTPLLNLSAATQASREALLAEELLEMTETVQKICAAIPLRLEHGDDPLPHLYRAMFPHGADGAAHVADGTASSATPDKALPAPSLDSEFAYIQQCFADAATKESNEVKLKFYGLYKQATEGDINISKPWSLVGRAKWDAWNKLKGMTLVDAKRAYISEYKAMQAMKKTS